METMPMGAAKGAVTQLAEKIIHGDRLQRGDDFSALLQAETSELCAGANEIRKAMCGDRAELCTIVNGRSGRCSEDCRFCAQSCHYHTHAEEYPFLPREAILADAQHNESAGIHRYSIVTSGRGLKGAEWEQALDTYCCLRRKTGLKLCASHGLQTVEEFRQLKKAGVGRFHCNLETSRRYFPQVCTTHSYEDKIANIQRAQQAGLQVCSGGIIGMGETWGDRIDMALTLYELGVRSIPLNILRPITGTPFEHLPPISQEDVRRTVAIFRYLNPEAWVRMAAGRGQFADGGAVLFESGANAAITGDMLTTTGTGIAEDIQMLRRLGYTLTNEKEKSQ